MKGAGIVFVVALASAGWAQAAVYKCRSDGGSLTYQQLPCATHDETLANELATEYPAPNVIERERLLLREAEMYKRLEAQRDRLSAEAVARISRPEPVVISSEPAYAPAWGARLGPRPFRRAPMHGWASERKF